MSKITLSNITTLTNEPAALSLFNNNSAIIQTAFDNTLSRDGTSPNTMAANIDMNSHRILNLPLPVNDTEPARLIDVKAGIVGPAGPSPWASPVAWVTATAYVVGPPASVVTQGGESYVCLISHTSGVFATDLAANKWIKVAAKGVDGSGTISGTTVNGVAYATGASAVASTAALTNGQIIVGVTSSPPSPVTVSGDITINSTGVVAIKSSVSLLGSPTLGNGATPVISLTGSGGGNTTVNIGTAAVSPGIIVLAGGTSGAISIAAQAATTGNLTVAPGTMIGSTGSAVWFDNIPQNSQSAAYTLVIGDAQKHLYHPSADTTARIWTIPANASVAFPIGTAVTFINDTSAGVVTISITTDTLVLAGAGTTGSRTLAANGTATAVKITATRWMISGVGLT